MAEPKLPKRDQSGDLPTTKDGWIDYVNRLHDEALVSKRVYERQWTANLAFTLGFQDLIFNQSTGVLDFPKDYQIPVTVNRIGAFVEARQAKLTKSRPIGRVIPNTTDPLDVRAAKYSDQLLMHIWRAIDMDAEMDQMTIVELITGNAFIKTVWDPTSGQYIEQTVQQEPGYVEIDEEGLVKEKIFMGEVSSKYKSPFSVLVPFDNVSKICDQDWVLERDHFSISECERLYPHLKGKIKTEGQDQTRTQFEQTVEKLTSTLLFAHKTKEHIREDSINSEILVKTLWIKPNPQFNRGLVIVVIGDQLAHIGKFPHDYGYNIYPIVHFKEKNDGFHFWQQSTVERLIPLQKCINMVKRHKATSMALMGNPKWLIAKGSQVSEESMDDTTGEVIEYNSQFPMPQPAVISPLPEYVTEFEQSLIIDFRDVSNQREATSVPNTLTAAVALQTFAELSEESLSPIVKRFARGLELVSEQQLLLANEEYIEPRKVKIIGEDGKVGVQYLKAVDLRYSTDVHIEAESMIPELRGQKLQRLIDLWDRRIITDPNEFLSVMRYGNFDELVSKREKMVEQVALDIMQMKKGKQAEIHPAQNHMLYVQQLSEFVQTPEFMQLIPERKELILMNLQGHIQQIAPEPEQPQQNQASVGSQFGPITPAGAEGGGV